MPAYVMALENGDLFQQENGTGVILVDAPAVCQDSVGNTCAGGNHYDVTMTLATPEQTFVNTFHLDNDSAYEMPSAEAVRDASFVLLRLMHRQFSSSNPHSEIQTRLGNKNIDLTV